MRSLLKDDARKTYVEIVRLTISIRIVADCVVLF